MLLFRQDNETRTDDELVQKYGKTAEPAYLEALFARYSHLVFLTAQKYLQNEEDSKDAAMEIFQQVATELRRSKVRNFKSWLYSVTKNHCLIKLRQKTHTVIRLEEDNIILSHFVEYPDSLHQCGEKERLLKKLEAAIRQLDKQQRLCIEKFYLEGKSYRQIAEENGLTLKKIKSYIQNGKRKLRLILTATKSKRMSNDQPNS